MDFRVMIEPQQGATYADQLALAKAAEGLGFSALFDPITSSPSTGTGCPGPRILGRPDRRFDDLFGDVPDVQRAYAQLFDIADIDQLELLAAEVMPRLT